MAEVSVLFYPTLVRQNKYKYSMCAWHSSIPHQAFSTIAREASPSPQIIQEKNIHGGISNPHPIRGPVLAVQFLPPIWKGKKHHKSQHKAAVEHQGTLQRSNKNGNKNPKQHNATEVMSKNLFPVAQVYQFKWTQKKLKFLKQPQFPQWSQQNPSLELKIEQLIQTIMLKLEAPETLASKLKL